jgi:hypothetical protein
LKHPRSFSKIRGLLHISILCVYPVFGGVEEMAKKKIPAVKTYELVWASPPPGGWDGKSRFFVQNGPVSANPPGSRPLRPAKKVVDSLKMTSSKGRGGGLFHTIAGSFGTGP